MKEERRLGFALVAVRDLLFCAALLLRPAIIDTRFSRIADLCAYIVEQLRKESISEAIASWA